MKLSIIMPVLEEGKKIGWRDAVKALWCIAKYGMSVPQNSRRPVGIPLEPEAGIPQFHDRMPGR